MVGAQRQMSCALGELIEMRAVAVDAEHIHRHAQTRDRRHQIAQHPVDAAVSGGGGEDGQIGAHARPSASSDSNNA